MKILVVDDSKTMRVIVSRIMKELGYEVGEASNGREAIDILKSDSSYSLVMADWNMPEMNGYDMVLNIKSDDNLKKIPIIMLTTENEISNVQKAINAGASDFITKPFKKETIQEKITKLINGV
ncbi:MAG: response regulator [Elusimicrobiales bacterium]|nr:response regulator [Elusimicrobiales bacterium]